MSHGLTHETLAEIHRVLSARPDVEKAILYGSRAKGTQRNGSDIDLALAGFRLDDRIVGQIADDFEDGSLPYRFDLCIVDQVSHAALLDHIRRVGIVLYQKQHAPGSPLVNDAETRGERSEPALNAAGRVVESSRKRATSSTYSPTSPTCSRRRAAKSARLVTSSHSRQRSTQSSKSSSTSSSHKM